MGFLALRQALAFYARAGVSIQRVLTNRGASYRSKLFAQTCHELVSNTSLAAAGRRTCSSLDRPDEDETTRKPWCLDTGLVAVHGGVTVAACRSPEPAKTKLKAIGVAWNAEGRPTVKNGEASPLYYSRAAFPAAEQRGSAFALLRGYMLANRPRRCGVIHRLHFLPEGFAIVCVIVNKITNTTENSVIIVNFKKTDDSFAFSTFC